MSGHAGGEPAIVREWRRSRARGGKGAGLVYATELSRITLDPASHQGSVVIGIAIWTPCYSRSLPHRVEEDAEPAALISGRIEMLVVLRGELVVREECNRMTWTFLIKLDTRRKDIDDTSGSFQNSTARTSPAKCQGGDGTSAAAPRGDRGAVNPFSISRPHHQWRISRALFQHEMLALVLFPTLGQTCDDLVVCAHPTLIRSRLNRATSPICSMLRPHFGTRRDYSGVESYKL